MAEGAEDQHGRARIDNFVDAAFAFATTLLVISVGDPPTDMQSLRSALLRIPGFAAGFALIALFWWAHYQYARVRPQAGGLSLVFSLAVVFVVLVYVFPLRLLMEAATFSLSGGRLPGEALIRSPGDLRFLFVTYSVGFLVLSGLYTAMFAHAARRGGHTADGGRRAGDTALTWAIQAAAATASIVLALTLPMDRASPLAGAPGWIYTFGGMAIAFFWGVVVPRRERRRAAAEAAALEAT